MSSILSRLILMLAAVAAMFCGPVSEVGAKENLRKSVGNQGNSGPSVIVVRIWKDGRECPTGAARLRPLRGTELDPNRYVDIGRISEFERRDPIERTQHALRNMLTLDITTMMNDARMKSLKDSLMPIDAGSYVLTAISCNWGNAQEWIGVDRPVFLFRESGRFSPVKGANFIEIRPGEVIDAGVLEIRSDEVGFFSAQTGYVAAQPAPPHERDALRDVAGKIRFTTFLEKVGKR
jgi:hypothetical protein